MCLILMVYACLIPCSLTNNSKCHYLAYFNLRWTCVVILHNYYFIIIFAKKYNSSNNKYLVTESSKLLLIVVFSLADA